MLLIVEDVLQPGIKIFAQLKRMQKIRKIFFVSRGFVTLL